MKNFFIQLCIAFVVTMLWAVVIAAIIVTWLGILIYQSIKWSVTGDGYSHFKKPEELMIPEEPAIQLKPVVVNHQLEEEFDRVFAEKPLPKPYTPSENPLYQETAIKSRHNLRNEKGRFVKRKDSPITRYGVPTWERYKEN